MSSIRSSSSSTTWPDFSTLQQSLCTTADTDGDGSISKDEFTTLLSSNSRLASDMAKLTSTTSSESGATATAASIFAALDTSGTGELTEAQFKTALSDARQAGQTDADGGPPPPPGGDFSAMLKNVFAQGDTNGDGAISADELQAMSDANPGLASDLATIAGTGTSSGSTVTAAFSALDKDGDGKVSSDEFVTGVNTAHEATVASLGAGSSDSAGTSTTSLSASLYSSEQVQQILMAALAKLQQAGGYRLDGGSAGVTATLKATA